MIFGWLVTLSTSYMIRYVTPRAIVSSWLSSNS